MQGTQEHFFRGRSGRRETLFANDAFAAADAERFADRGMSGMITAIRNGMLMDPVSGRSGPGELLLQDDRIADVRWRDNRESPEKQEDAQGDLRNALWERTPDRVLDAGGCIVAPGLVDVHVHFRDPGYLQKEDLDTGCAAAARGGVTTVVCMANTKPVVDQPGILEEILNRAQHSDIRVRQASAVTVALKGQCLVDMEAMANSGAACFTDDGIPITDEKLLLEAMQRAKALKLPVSLHEEHPLLMKEAGVHPGEAAALLGYGGAAPEAEEILVARDAVLALYTGACINIQHISSGRSVEIVRQAKKWGADIHAEATPHHFTLTQEAVLRWGTNARMNPPLRTEMDRQEIIRGLADGTIDMIVTDHAPHTREEKAKPLHLAPSGIIGLETSLGLGIRSLVQPGHLTMMELLTRMSAAPAAVYAMPQEGLSPGADADLVIFSEREEWTVDHFASKSANSPFLGWKLPGKIHYTICRGRCVYEG